jgi:tetratricopeptide (TPR) repeat protein
MRKTLALSLILTAFAAADAFAGAEARISGTIVDAQTKQPIPNATINVEATEAKTYKKDFNAKKDGTYAIFLIDGTIQYKFTVSASGYQSYQEVMKLKTGGTSERTFELNKLGGGGGAITAKADPAVTAYNEGAALANAGDTAGALKKFEEAIAASPSLLAAWGAKAKLHLRQKQYPQAIEAANKVLEIDDSDGDMWSVLNAAYTATGDKANAAKAADKMPKNAGMLFNDAAKQINAGNDAAAETLLKQAIAADESLAVAYYELGMVYVRAGKTAEAKTALTKYIELDPNGREAATAKEMLSYLK